VAEWLARAVSVVDGCGEPEAEVLLQQGITSLEDLADVPPDLLTQLPGIDEAGAQAIKAKAVVLAVEKAAEDERRRLEEEQQAAEAAARLAQELVAERVAEQAAAAAAEDSGEASEESGEAAEPAPTEETP
jgi:hypothetical protein